MAETVILVAAVVQLTELAVGSTKLSNVYLSDVRNATESRKLYTREISALTQVLRQLKSSLEQHRSPSTALSEVVLQDCQKELSSPRLKLGRMRLVSSGFST